jgi:pyruvate,water dikinase
MTTETFDVAWEDPADAQVTWIMDKIHGPEPTTPLGGFMAMGVTHGFAKTFSEYSVPAKMRQRYVNYWLYGNMMPLDLDPAEAERMMGEAQARIGGAMAQVGSLWTDTYLPEIKSLLEPLESADLFAMDDPTLAEHWDLTISSLKRLWEIHFLAIIPAYVAVSEFDEMYLALLTPIDPHESHRLLQGIGNKTVDTGLALWELSRQARELPEVLAVLTDPGIDDPLAELEVVAGGAAFLNALERYLDEYGRRGDKWDVAYPSWIEDPTPVLRTLRDHVTRETHPAQELQRLESERQRLIADARAKLTTDEQRGGFDFLLAAAEAGIVITEDHGYWIDFRGMYQVRRVAVELGHRFADAGVIASPDDVFFLDVDEVAETARALPGLDRRALIAERREGFERAKLLDPPPFLGVPPDPEAPVNPIQRAFGKLFGGPPPEGSTATELRGYPGSPGVVRGVARVMRSIDEADKLADGDILVADATAPPWTPFFAIAGAVVTDTGGILSHCAVVAREYGIPAVVGCGDAMKKIVDGQLIEVDGDAGVVRVVV